MSYSPESIHRLPGGKQLSIRSGSTDVKMKSSHVRAPGNFPATLSSDSVPTNNRFQIVFTVRSESSSRPDNEKIR